MLCLGKFDIYGLKYYSPGIFYASLGIIRTPSPELHGPIFLNYINTGRERNINITRSARNLRKLRKVGSGKFV